MAKFIGLSLGDQFDDNFSGGASRDYLYGNIGNDTLSGGDGVDTMDGGAGDSDWVSFADATGGVVIDLTPVAFPAESITLADLSEASIELIDFEGAQSTIIESWDGRTDVARVIKPAGAEINGGAGGSAGTTVVTGAGDSIDTIDFTASSTTVTLRVWVPAAGIVVRMKVEDSTDVTRTCEADALTTVAEGWETLTFDFSNAATNQGNPTAALNLNYTFDKVSIFFNFGLNGASGGDGTYYFDDLKFISDEGNVGTISDDGFGNAETIGRTENVLGSAQADLITGSAGRNTLSGAGGNDTVNGGDGIDQLDGGDGTDTLSFSGAENGVEVVLASGELVTEVVTFEESTEPTFAVFGPDNDTNAASAAVVDDPAGGNNQVGQFIKGAGALTWAGVVVATGDNFSVQTLPFTASDKTMTMRVWSAEVGTEVLLKLENASDGGINVGALATTTVANAWQTLTFTFGDALPGPGTGALNLDATYNKAVIFFNFGEDGATGGGTFYFDDLKFEGSAVSTVSDDGFGNADEVGGFENVIGSAFGDSITGDNGPSVLEGLGGSDSLVGADGSDNLLGGDQADTLVGDGGNDTLNGGNGNDSMTGGSGNDLYVVEDGADQTIESDDGGTDTVQASLDHTLSSNVEKLTLTGSSALDGTGNALANTLTGNAGINLLTGGNGNDSLFGGSGNDTLNGSDGADRMTGGNGSDRYLVQDSADQVIESADSGIDTVQASIDHTLSANVEMLTLTGSAALNGTGNTLANTVTGNAGINVLTGGDGSDSLLGGDGNDTLNGDAGKDSLDGGAGADRMNGGAANDTYVVQNSGDVVIEATDGGTDTVNSSVTHTLGAEVEKLTLTGTKAINGQGNALDNTLVGNGANNVLRGNAGNDTLTGGAGDDVFRFSSAINTSTNVDTLLDFNVANDTLELENSVFTKLATTGVLNAANFRASTGGNAGDANDFVLYETDTGKLFYDADGNGAGAKLLIAKLTDLPTLAASDIFVT